MARDVKPEVYTSERCYIAEVLNSPEYPEVSVAQARVSPGITTRLHAVSVIEWYVIHSGNGRMFLGDSEPFDVRQGSVIMIPAGAAQKIENSGNTDLVFSCVCAPRWTTECYSELE
jgi:mannose-6-phosphate isomerase-like protein (cupin superfamily)